MLPQTLCRDRQHFEATRIRKANSVHCCPSSYNWRHNASWRWGDCGSNMLLLTGAKPEAITQHDFVCPTRTGLDVPRVSVLPTYSPCKQREVSWMGLCSPSWQFWGCFVDRWIVCTTRVPQKILLQEKWGATTPKAPCQASRQGTCMGWNRMAWNYQNLHFWWNNGCSNVRQDSTGSSPAYPSTPRVWERSLFYAGQWSKAHLKSCKSLFCWEWSKLVVHLLRSRPDANPIENLWHELKVSEAYSELRTYGWYNTVSYKLHACPACLALWNWTSLACLVLAGMVCSMQLYNCMYCPIVMHAWILVVFLFCRNTFRRVIKPANKDELVQGIQQFWATVDMQKWRRYIGHLKRVLPCIVELNGDTTGF